MKTTRSNKPDGRLFVEDGAGCWVTNRTYKTRVGADKLLASIMKTYHTRRGITYSVAQDRNGLYRVQAISNNWLNQRGG